MLTSSNIYKSEGVRGFWRGNSIACVRVWPYNAIQFYLYTLLKDKLSDPKTGQWYYRFPLAFLSGTVAGTAAMCVTYPMDVIKTRMTLTTCDKTKAKYKSSFSAFWIMMRQESPLVFFTGIWPSLIGTLKWVSILRYQELYHLLVDPLWHMNYLVACGENQKTCTLYTILLMDVWQPHSEW